jgi:hypothetical protein
VLVQVPPHSKIKVPVVFDPDDIPRDSVSELMVLAASNRAYLVIGGRRVGHQIFRLPNPNVGEVDG